MKAEGDRALIFQVIMARLQTPALVTDLCASHQVASRHHYLPQRDTGLTRGARSSRTFGREAELTRHQNSLHFPKLQIECFGSGCKLEKRKPFRRADKFSQHLGEAHGWPEPFGTFDCVFPECNSKWLPWNALLDHLKAHDRREMLQTWANYGACRVLLCPIGPCGAHFPNFGQLRHHTEVHDLRSQQQAQTYFDCDKQYATNSTARRYYRDAFWGALAWGAATCSVCGLSWPRQCDDNVLSHLKSHRSLDPAQLLTHVRHMLPYTSRGFCPICLDICYRIKGHLRGHAYTERVDYQSEIIKSFGDCSWYSAYSDEMEKLGQDILVGLVDA